MSKALKLRAESKEDLIVLSSALQDAILKVGEIGYNSKGRHLNLRLSRFRHEYQGEGQRVQCGLRMDSVLSVKSRGIDRSDPEAYAVLLSIEVQKEAQSKSDPSCEITLIFAGGGEISVQAECIDITLADIAAGRSTDKLPLHYDV